MSSSLPDNAQQDTSGGANNGGATSGVAKRPLSKKKRPAAKPDSARHYPSQSKPLSGASSSSSKASSLPPMPFDASPAVDLSQYYLSLDNDNETRSYPPDIPVTVLPDHHADKPHLPKGLESSAKTAPPASQEVQDFDDGQPVSTARLFVEPPRVTLPQLKRCMLNANQGPQKDDKDVDWDAHETLESWQREKSAPLNGHQLRHHHHHDLPASPNAIHSQTESEYHANHQSHPHQATNARRFITRTPRSHSRQSANGAGHSPPPAAHYRGESSSSESPSPTRPLRSPAGGGSAVGGHLSSANGNSSAYETAATSVMTHSKQQQTTDQRHQQHQQQVLASEAEVPKEIQPNSLATAARPVSGDSDKKKEEELHQQQQRQRYSSPSSPRQPTTPIARRLSSSDLSPKLSPSGGCASEPSVTPTNHTGLRLQARSASQPSETPPSVRRLVPTATISMKQNLSELHFTGGPSNMASPNSPSPPKSSTECTVRMRPRSSTMLATGPGSIRQQDNLTTLQLSPVQKHQARTPDPSPKRSGDRDKSAKRKSNLNRSLNEEATQDGDDAMASRRRRRRELGMARPLVPGDDEALRELLHSPQKSSCSESTNSKSEPSRSSKSQSSVNNQIKVPPLMHPNVPIRTLTAVMPPTQSLVTASRVSRRSDTLPLGALRKQRTENVNQKLNERTKTDLAEIMKIAEQANAADEKEPAPSRPQEREEGGHENVNVKMSPILRRKSTDELHSGSANQSSPPAPNQIVSILKKKEHAFGECNSSASSNASPVTFSANVVDTPTKHKRQGILKKRSSLDESRYYSRSHSPDERSILIKSARRNSLEEAGSTLSPSAQGQLQHGILKQSSYDSSKSDGCPSATECQPHSILKKKDSLSTPSDGGAHVSKHVSISQAVTLAAAELDRVAHDSEHVIDDYYVTPNNEEYEIRPILKQESTSSEEAARPPKPILKKKSFGEADELEIRPILKTSRKSSREEFDLSGLGSESGEGEASGMRPILKTESPSKRRSLGHESGSISPGLLKRRTRSLERHDAGPVLDLAEALNAISTSQRYEATTDNTTPVDFVTVPAAPSVADRIKQMEQLSRSCNSSAAAGINSSWESPLQQQQLGQASHTPKLLKPSVLRRDLYRERYKTQPVTSEEKNFFKANSTPFDISATSAFKPTKALEQSASASASTYPQQPLISPITGQPLSHVPAPLQLSSSTNWGGFGASRLSRSATQPLQSPRVLSLAHGSSGIARQSSVGEDDASLSEQLTRSLGTDSDLIFQMSAMDDDSAIQSLGDEASASASTAAPTQSSGVGVTRSNSVRARANMFQQLQEKTRLSRETGGEQSRTPANRQASSRHSPPPTATNAAAEHSPPLLDESNTPNTSQDADEDFEPSSLSLAERLAFFSSLCETGGGGGSGGGGGHFRSRTSSYTRSPPFLSIERCGSVNSYNSCGMSNTPRSSTTASSASVTPTPMEYSPIPVEKESRLHQFDQTLETTSEQEERQGGVEVMTRTNAGFHQLSRSATAPVAAPCAREEEQPLAPSEATPTLRRIKLRTVGKLVMPDAFLSDRNNNTNRHSCTARLQTIEDIQVTLGVRKIGKIKSRFIEQQDHQASTPEAHLKTPNGDGSRVGKQHNSHSDSSDENNASDSSKENYAANQQHQPTTPLSSAEGEVPEMRRKLARWVNGPQQQQPIQAKAAPVNRRHTTEITSASNLNKSAPLSGAIAGFGKYFGLKETNSSSASSATLTKTNSMPPSLLDQQQQPEALNEHVRVPLGNACVDGLQKRRELLKRPRSVSMEVSGIGTGSSVIARYGKVFGLKESGSPMSLTKTKSMPVSHKADRLYKIVTRFEEIVVTPEDLESADEAFDDIMELDLNRARPSRGIFGK